LLPAAGVETAPWESRANGPAGAPESAGPKWHVLWTHSHSEQLVHDQLAGKGFRVFLPTVGVWSRRGGLRRLIRAPLFPGYLFLHHSLDKFSYVEVRKSRGLVRILGERWDRLAVVPDEEMQGIQKLHGAGLPALPHPYLREGQRVRITRGPLADVEGILIRMRPDQGVLVLSIHLLQRSVAVEVDCTQVVPA
jgi:transcription antitermination factor NusG